MAQRTELTTEDLAADRDLADRALRADPDAQDAIAALLRPMLDRIAATALAPGLVAETTVSALFVILQAEERILSAWSRETPLRAYLAVVAARVSLHEEARWRRLRGQEAEIPLDEEHPGDDALARDLLGLPQLPSSGEPPHDMERCTRCSRVRVTALIALGELGDHERGDDG